MDKYEKLLNKLKVGDQILFEYGLNPKEFFIFKITATSILLGHKDWCNSSAMYIKKERLIQEGFEIIGKGKYNILSELPIIGDSIAKYK